MTLEYIQNCESSQRILKALLDGDGPTYANAQVGMDALAKRYMSYRLKLEYWLKHKVYKPIAEIQGFYKPKNGEVATAHLQDKEIRKEILYIFSLVQTYTKNEK